MLTTFFSTKKQNANIETEEENIEDEPLASFATSLQNSGKHRTGAEIDDENAVRQTAVGGILKWSGRRYHLAINTLYQNLDKPLNRNTAIYNQYAFNEKHILNRSP